MKHLHVVVGNLTEAWAWIVDDQDALASLASALEGGDERAVDEALARCLRPK